MVSDFSSHPYSHYYGTSGSTAKQNFQQNDEFNDIYGYGEADRFGDMEFDDRYADYYTGNVGGMRRGRGGRDAARVSTQHARRPRA